MGRRRNIPQDTKDFHYYNANPKDKWTGDCVIRALSVSLEIPYEKVLQDLVDLSLKTGWSVTSRENYEKYLSNLGWVKNKQPRKSDNTRYEGWEFIKYLKRNHPESRFVIASIGHHHITCFGDMTGKSLQCIDIWDCTDRCVGNYFTKK